MDCLFCKIIEGTIPSTKVFENEHVLAFRDITPAAPTHILIIPKKHIATMNDVTREDDLVVAEIFAAARHIAKEEGYAEAGYRLINNVNADGGQVIYHLHFHLLAGKLMGPLLAE
ncbi:MAG: histidine triad nucleotide-binding protein [Candidatus Pristimantibacillus lignocellulolyticus]|uniref:Histidine triad nucleotide-binding protein n=1 Tax=Candidatus Pristimantibacillus lignocellulolyticus TaxID=2994561 RepID=A0A9J6ZE65_9BACL|nr:MAG: histidine triad nucleotide-binding protein [Candidatus Pristimantibacillus lignocellulolyticus]